MSDHARLSPSTAHRWKTCPGSVALATNFPNRATRNAAEGTVCHLMMSNALTGKPVPAVGSIVEADGFRIEVTDDMVEWVYEIVDYVLQYLADHPGSTLLSEERVCPGRALGYPDDVWGTADIVILAPDHLVVLDAKFGHHLVKAVRNPQVSLYALGIMAELGWIYDRVVAGIYQPRAPGPHPLLWEMTAAELQAEVPALVAAVRATYDPAAPLVPDDDACRFCPAAGGCPKLQEHALAMAQLDFIEVPIRVEDLLKLLENADRIRDGLNAAERYAEGLIAAGAKVPGFIRVYGNKHRAWKDPARAEAAIKSLGYDPFTPKLLTPAQAEKKVGKATAKLLAPLIETPRGEPTLAREGDPRTPVDTEFPTD